MFYKTIKRNKCTITQTHYYTATYQTVCTITAMNATLFEPGQLTSYRTTRVQTCGLDNALVYRQKECKNESTDICQSGANGGASDLRLRGGGFKFWLSTVAYQHWASCSYPRCTSVTEQYNLENGKRQVTVTGEVNTALGDQALTNTLCVRIYV